MTTTLKMTGQEIRDLQARLAGFEFRPLQHGHFSARGEGVVVNAYRSGKVVVQGAGEARFLEAHGLGDVNRVDETVAGSDESGKGDYFGPLVVAAVVVSPGRELPVRDSKQMSDAACLKAAVAVRRLPHAVRALAPAEYNAHHAAEGNVALFLSRMHAEAIAEAVGRADGCRRVVIDQFTFAHRLEGDLKRAGVELPVEIRPRAEDNPAVAAASVLARAEFLIALRELGSEYGVELPKGAGDPVERVARRLFADFGMNALEAVAKVHFKTTRKVTERLF